MSRHEKEDQEAQFKGTLWRAQLFLTHEAGQDAYVLYVSPLIMLLKLIQNLRLKAIYFYEMFPFLKHIPNYYHINPMRQVGKAISSLWIKKWKFFAEKEIEAHVFAQDFTSIVRAMASI